MSDPLTTYRVYAFDGVHKILSSDLIEAASDEDAVARATAAGFGPRCEIWERDRLVFELKEDRQSA